MVDGEVLSVTPWQALTDGAGRDTELLVGHTRDEQRLFTALNGLLGEVSEEQAANALDIFAPDPDGARRYRDVRRPWRPRPARGCLGNLLLPRREFERGAEPVPSAIADLAHAR